MVNHVKWHSTVLRTSTTTLNVMESNLSNQQQWKRQPDSASTHYQRWSTSRMASRSDTTVKNPPIDGQLKSSPASLMWPWSGMNFSFSFYLYLYYKHPEIQFHLVCPAPQNTPCFFSSFKFSSLLRLLYIFSLLFIIIILMNTNYSLHLNYPRKKKNKQNNWPLHGIVFGRLRIWKKKPCNYFNFHQLKDGETKNFLTTSNYFGGQMTRPAHDRYGKNFDLN